MGFMLLFNVIWIMQKYKRKKQATFECDIKQQWMVLKYLFQDLTNFQRFHTTATWCWWQFFLMAGTHEDCIFLDRNYQQNVMKSLRASSFLFIYFFCTETNNSFAEALCDKIWVKNKNSLLISSTYFTCSRAVIWHMHWSVTEVNMKVCKPHW